MEDAIEFDVHLERSAEDAWRWSDGAKTSEVAISLDGDDQTCTVEITERLLLPRPWAQPSIPPVEASVA